MVWHQYSTQSSCWTMDEEKDPSTRVQAEIHKETNSKLHDPHDAVSFENEQRASAERRLVKKLDRRLLPTIVIIFIMNYIDVSYPLYSASFCLLKSWFSDQPWHLPGLMDLKLIYIWHVSANLFATVIDEEYIFSRIGSITVFCRAGNLICGIRPCSNSLKHGNSLP